MTPWTTYRGDEHIYRGFDAVSDAIRAAEARAQQQQQFAAADATERRGQDFRYGMHADDSARGYFGLNMEGDLGVQRLNQQEREATRRHDPMRIQPVPLQNAPGMFGIPMTGQVIEPGKTSEEGASPFGIVFDATGKPIAEKAMPLLDPDGKLLGHKAVLNGKETLVKPQGENIGTAIGKALGGGGGAAPPTSIPGLPTGGANTPGGTGGPASNPLLGGAPPSQFQPGKIYRDANGSRAKYNADGSWTPVP